jgi:2-keto-4-pentenoate hydratase/2-oxohepta-3-ene-1,7-dioic acid hydratase in catechol pathway
MKIVRFIGSDGKVSRGCLQDDGRVLLLHETAANEFTVTSQTAEVRKLLTPIVPSQIIGIGLNYRRHAAESGAKSPETPVVFFKGINTPQNPGDPIILPRFLPSLEVDYECELAVVIGKPCKNVAHDEALSYVLGYTCANDVSARDWQLKRGGGQWCRGKSFDTFSPLGPCLVTTDEIPDPQQLRISTTLNGQIVQDWTTGDMIFDVATIIAFLSGSSTLPAGTVILTGTPHGVGMAASPPRWLQPGDQVTIGIDRIGELRNNVVMEAVEK